MPGSSDAAVLVERDGERDLIDHALTGATLGAGRVVLLYGQAGAGRSSLLRTAARTAETRGLAVLDASGSELERGYGFGLVRQLLEARLARLNAAQRRSLLAEAGADAASALGLGTGELTVSSASFDQIQGVHRLVTRLAALKPLLVAVDDLQWSDQPSLDFLCFLGHRVTRMPVTIVATWRRGEPGVRAGRLQALAGQPDTVFLTLSALSREGVGAVLRGGGGEPDDGVVDAVHAQTGGQPFLVSELVAGLKLRGVPTDGQARAAIEAITPESVRRNVVARLGRHPERVRRLAYAVAVLGDAPLALAAELAGLEIDAGRGVAHALVRAGILRDDATLAYAQPLVRAAVYDTLTSLERARLHRAAAGLLRPRTSGSDPVELERVAWHLVRCEAIGDPRLGDILRVAALRAAGRRDHAAARRFLERAVGEIEDPRDRAETLTRLAETELRTGDLEAARTHADKARRVAPAPADRVAATLAAARAVAATQGCAPAVELLEAESFRLDDAGGETRLRAAAATLRACDDAPPWASVRARARIERLGGKTAEERALLAACASDLVRSGAGGAVHVAGLCRRALAGEGPRAPGELAAISDYLACRAALLADAGELVDATLDRAAAPRDGTEPEAACVFILALRAQAAMARGDLAAAQSDASAALDRLDARIELAFHRRVRRDLLASLTLLLIERGRPDDAEPVLARLAACSPSAGSALACLRIALALARSEPAAALAAAAECRDVPAGSAGWGLAWRPWAALAHLAADERPAALELAAAHLAHARAWGGASLLGRALVVRAVVDPGGERIALLEQAVTVLEDAPARLELARATIELGAALRRARRRTDARERLARGSDIAHHCGADGLAARARAELVAAGARPRRAAFSGVGSLTESERRVAQLAATGMTNRAIAHELVVSAKTVSGQLTAVYRKLGIHDRVALAAVMRAADGGERTSQEPPS